jgi:DNA-binding CsgD family transcriptional regulator
LDDRGGHAAPDAKRRLLHGVCRLTDADRATASVASLDHAGNGAARAPHAVPVSVSAVRNDDPAAGNGRDVGARSEGPVCEIPWHAFHDELRRRRGGGDSGDVSSWCAVTAPLRHATAGSDRAGERSGGGGGGGHHCIHAFLPLADAGDVAACLTVHRGPRQRRFSTRDEALVCALHAEVGWVYRADVLLVSPDTRSLSPRERETLKHLLAGLGEKQIAARMGLRYNTVHHYVKALHRHFGVSTRAELLARWVGR